MSLRFVALPLAIIAIGQVIGSYAGGVMAGSRYRAVLIAATCALGGACGFLFFAVELHSGWPWPWPWQRWEQAC